MTDVFCPPCVCARGAALRHFLHLNCLHLCEEQALSTTGLNDAGVSPWLDEFFGNCSQLSGCDPTKLEGIAFHDYNGNVARLLQRASGLSSRYGPTIGQPAGARIWITVSGTASQQTLSPFSEPCTKACCRLRSTIGRVGARSLARCKMPIWLKRCRRSTTTQQSNDMLGTQHGTTRRSLAGFTHQQEVRVDGTDLAGLRCRLHTLLAAP